MLIGLDSSISIQQSPVSNSSLSIQFRGDHVDASEDGDDVADHVAFDHFGEALVVDVAVGPGAVAPGVMIGTLKSTAGAPCPSQLSMKQRYGSSLRISRLTPDALAIGPLRLQAIASSRVSVPIPLVRSTKMRFLFSSFSTSSTARGM